MPISLGFGGAAPKTCRLNLATSRGSRSRKDILIAVRCLFLEMAKNSEDPWNLRRPGHLLV
jgi:hypothetical protein